MALDLTTLLVLGINIGVLIGLLLSIRLLAKIVSSTEKNVSSIKNLENKIMNMEEREERVLKQLLKKK